MRCCGTCRAVYRSGFDRCPTDGTELATFDADPVVGTTINGLYEVEECVGEGAMGRVYRAHHLRLHRRQVALKILLGDLAASVAMRLRFTQEAQAASLLSHPNVVAVLDFGKTPQGLLYLAMEYVEGRSLARVIIDEGPLGEARAIKLARQLCFGLAHAHNRGLIHRDFKPDNVLVVDGPEGETPRIADFGLAIFSDGDHHGARLTTAGTVVGTPLYTAPEQALDRGIDLRADLFALGITMYEMLAGCPPFDDTSPIEMLHNNLAAARPRIAERCPGVVVSASLERIVHRLMSSDRDQRFSSAQAVVDALDALPPPGTEEPAGWDREEQSGDTTRMYAMRPARGRRLALAAVLAGALAAVGVYWSLSSGQLSGDRPAAALVTTEADAIAVATASKAGKTEAAIEPAAPKPAPEASQPPPVVQEVEPEAEPEPLVIVATTTPRAPRRRAPAPAAPAPAAPATLRESRGHGPAEAADDAAVADAAPEPDAPRVASPVIDPQPEPPVASPPAEPTARITLPQSAARPSRPTSLPSRAAPDARAVINALSIEGSLSDAEVRRGIERVHSRLDGCYRAAGGAARAGVQVSFVIDEGGRASQVRASGPNGLSACITDAIAGVRTRVAPDVGDVRVSLRVGPARSAE